MDDPSVGDRGSPEKRARVNPPIEPAEALVLKTRREMVAKLLRERTKQNR